MKGGARARRPGAPLAVIVRRADRTVAASQAAWIAAMEPWSGLGYGEAGLARFLRRAAMSGQVWTAAGRTRQSGRRKSGQSKSGQSKSGQPALGLLVLQPDVLLGNFVALLAVQSEAAGRGIGRALMSCAQEQTFTTRRWLYLSCDATNRAALGFYRHLGFARVGRLPDLLRAGRTEILLRQGRP